MRLGRSTLRGASAAFANILPTKPPNPQAGRGNCNVQEVSVRIGRAKAEKSIREVDGISFDREHLNQALSVVSKAGFAYHRMMGVLERHDSGYRVAVTDFPAGRFSQADNASSAR